MAEFAIPIPTIPALSGATLFVQGGAPDPLRGSFGAGSLTLGLGILIGD